MTQLLRLELHACDHCVLSCIGCNHLSPFLGRNEYPVEDYLPWLDKLVEMGVKLDALAVSGGEPFLHKDIGGFVRTLRERYSVPIQVYTNAFWLRNEDSITKYAEVFANADLIMISKYRPIVDRLGLPEMTRLIALLGERFPAMKVGSHQDGVVTEFGQVTFSEEPVARPQPDQCAVKDCTQLLTDGRMFRCTYGYATFAHPGATRGFKESVDIVYDLTKDVGVRDFDAWAAKFPMDACLHCGCGRETWTPWVSDTSIKTMNRDQYEDRLTRLGM